ncbi:dihydroorotate dehydrogenase electron transfer subunit [Devosia sp. 2618]|uniref:dihydroorotate dehydrogenase electron transfer subunit n=1 Tax=Devosia sp. 2618 TaxID=3156454 RepID=UPI0033963780
MQSMLAPSVHDSSAPQGDVDDVVATVVSHQRVNAEYNLLVLAAQAPACNAVAGQFFNLECPSDGDDQPFFRRPMSTYKADPVRGEVEFLYKVTGAGTRGLATLNAGDEMRILGPLGHGFTLDPAWKNIVILGRGVGLATLAPLAELAAANGVGVTAIISARGPEQVMSVERFSALGARIETVLDSDGSSAPDNVEAVLRALHGQGYADALFTCGSNRLMLLMQRLGAELNIPGQVAMEQHMACGLGMCFCCVRNFKVGDKVDSRRVCWDGPVFDLQEALSW